MSQKKCKTKGGETGPENRKDFVCKKCGLGSNKEKKLCKPKVNPFSNHQV